MWRCEIRWALNFSVKLSIFIRHTTTFVTFHVNNRMYCPPADVVSKCYPYLYGCGQWWVYKPQDFDTGEQGHGLYPIRC